MRRTWLTLSCFSLAAIASCAATETASTGAKLGKPGPDHVPPGLVKVIRPHADQADQARVRALVRDLLKEPAERARASSELVALDWRAIPDLEDARWNSTYPLTLFAERVLNEMPLSAWARDGEYIRSKDGAVMVWVPPGEIAMPNWALESGYPRRQVHVDGFFIDRFCVTNRMFARFLEENGGPDARFTEHSDRSSHVHLIDGHWTFAQGQGNRPIWNGEGGQYDGYAEWAGALLPTGAQWERAAGASDGRRYPWGNEPCTQLRAQFENYWCDDTVPVWWFPQSDSPFGCRQMTGNVLEYALDRVMEKDLEVVFDEHGGNPVGYRLPWYFHRLLKGGGADEGEEALPVRGYEIMCGG